MYLVSIRVGKDATMTLRCKDILEDKLIPKNLLLVGITDSINTRAGMMKNIKSWSCSRDMVLDFMCGELEEVVAEEEVQESPAVTQAELPETHLQDSEELQAKIAKLQEELKLKQTTDN